AVTAVICLDAIFASFLLVIPVLAGVTIAVAILPKIAAFDNARRAAGADMKQHRVAILGGAGFIGRYIVKRLAERGDVLTVGGRNAAAAKFLKLKGDVGQVGLVNLSIADETLLSAFVTDQHTVVNLVGILHESGAQ